MRPVEAFRLLIAGTLLVGCLGTESETEAPRKADVALDLKPIATEALRGTRTIHWRTECLGAELNEVEPDCERFRRDVESLRLDLDSMLELAQSTDKVGVPGEIEVVVTATGHADGTPFADEAYAKLVLSHVIESYGGSAPEGEGANRLMARLRGLAAVRSLVNALGVERISRVKWNHTVEDLPHPRRRGPEYRGFDLKVEVVVKAVREETDFVQAKLEGLHFAVDREGT